MSESAVCFEYRFKNGILSGERRFRVEGAHVVIEKYGVETERVPLDSIQEVTLLLYKVRSGDEYKCTLTTLSSRKISFTSWSGLETYGAFVRGLHRALLPYRETIRFHANSRLTYAVAVLWVAMFSAFGLSSVVGGTYQVIHGEWGGFLSCLVGIVLAFMGWRGWSRLSAAKPRDYVPDAIPATSLP